MARDYCFTSFDTIDFDKDKVKYICYGKEICPETKREHLQGFVMFKRTCRIPQCKKWLGSETVHVEPRRGTRDHARDYCFKEDKEAFEFGEFEALTKEQLFGKSKKFIIDNYPEFYQRFHRVINERQDQGPKWRDVEVEWICGPPGCGKTRYAMEHDSVYKLDSPYTWFDGYSEEEVLLIDDYTQDAIPRGMLLNLLDGYRLRLPTKGGFTYGRWRKVIVTSNSDPSLYWDAALKRRVTLLRRAG